jgi:hypothetical protein
MTATEKNNATTIEPVEEVGCRECIEGTVCTAQCDTEPTTPSAFLQDAIYKELIEHAKTATGCKVESREEVEEEKKVIEILPRRVSWRESIAAIFTDGFFVAVFFVVFVASVTWDSIRSRARVVRAYFFPDTKESKSADGRFPMWYRQEETAKFWENKALTRANPGTLISCHDCPFRILEDSLGSAQAGYSLRIDGEGWGTHEEREAWVNTSRAYRAQNTMLYVCAHPANGKWGEGRYGAHTPDEKTCPRALLARMNPIRRAYWQWRMKRHIKKYGATPKML